MNEISDFLIKEFNKLFKNDNDDFLLFFAPGRINFIGEHTDNTGGLVFPAGIDCGTYILAKKNNSHLINISSLNFGNNVEIIDTQKKQFKSGLWTDYFKGVLKELQIENNDLFQGFDAVVFGNIPNGAGLSSSASIEMASVVTVLGMNNKKIPAPGSTEMVLYTLLSQRCENNFVGVNCGIMDQFSIGNAKKDCAIKLNCKDLSFEYSHINLGEYSILVANTNKKRRLEESQYNRRRFECETGFKKLKELGIEKDVLGEVTIEEWNILKSQFDNNPVIKKRLNHVITENNRVTEVLKALNKNDIKTFSELINCSGESLKNDFEVTGIHLDALVDAARTTEGVIGSRMMGAGFGGCTLNIIETKYLNKIKTEISNKYFIKTNIKPEFYNFKIGDGTRLIQF